MDEIVSKTNPSQSEPLDRHRSSLEGIIDFSVETPLDDDQRARAKRQFCQIVDYFHKLEPEEPKNQRGTTYSRPLLIRYTYEYARSLESRDVFFRSFFRCMGLSLDADDGSQEDNRLDLDSGQVEALSSLFFTFADYLLDNFFLPCKRVFFPPQSSKSPNPTR
jgi:hypothetical protein